MKKINDNKVPIWKKILLAFESIVILMYVVVSVFFVWFKVDRNGFITSMSSNPAVRYYLDKTAKKDYEEGYDESYDEIAEDEE